MQKDRAVPRESSAIDRDRDSHPTIESRLHRCVSSGFRLHAPSGSRKLMPQLGLCVVPVLLILPGPAPSLPPEGLGPVGNLLVREVR